MLDLPAFAARLKQPTNAVATFVSASLPSSRHEALAKLSSAAGDAAQLRSLLAADLNTVILERQSRDHCRGRSGRS